MGIILTYFLFAQNNFRQFQVISYWLQMRIIVYYYEVKSI